MIAQSTLAKAVAGLTAGMLHAALVVVILSPDAAEIVGAGGGAEVRLGSGFAELVQGSIQALEVVETTHSVTALQPVAPMAPRAPEPPTATPLAPADPVAAQDAALAPNAPTPEPATEAAATSESIRAVPLAASVPVLRPTQVSDAPEMGRPVFEARQAPEAQPLQTRPAATAPRAPDQPIRAETALSGAPDRSARPATRPASVAEAAAARAVATPSAAASGNATRTATVGSTLGRPDAAAASSGAGASSASVGNAAASNYPGEVMRCISRAGRPRVAAQGVARVSFRIDGRGRVTSVTLAASSGNSDLDRAALRTISRAGPCPAPPPGAQTGYSIRIQGR